MKYEIDTIDGRPYAVRLPETEEEKKVFNALHEVATSGGDPKDVQFAEMAYMDLLDHLEVRERCRREFQSQRDRAEARKNGTARLKEAIRLIRPKIIEIFQATKDDPDVLFLDGLAKRLIDLPLRTAPPEELLKRLGQCLKTWTDGELTCFHGTVLNGFGWVEVGEKKIGRSPVTDEKANRLMGYPCIADLASIINRFPYLRSVIETAFDAEMREREKRRYQSMRDKAESKRVPKK